MPPRTYTHKTTRTEIRRNLARQYGPDGSSQNAELRSCYAVMQALPENEREIMEWCVEYVVNHVPDMGVGGALEMVMKMAQLDAVTCDGASGKSWIFPQSEESPHA